MIQSLLSNVHIVYCAMNASKRKGINQKKSEANLHATDSLGFTVLLQEYAECRDPDCHQKVSVTTGFMLASSEPVECTVTAMTITFLAGFAQVSLDLL